MLLAVTPHSFSVSWMAARVLEEDNSELLFGFIHDSR